MCDFKIDDSSFWAGKPENLKLDWLMKKCYFWICTCKWLCKTVKYTMFFFYTIVLVWFIFLIVEPQAIWSESWSPPSQIVFFLPIHMLIDVHVCHVMVLWCRKLIIISCRHWSRSCIFLTTLHCKIPSAGIPASLLVSGFSWTTKYRWTKRSTIAIYHVTALPVIDIAVKCSI